MKWIVIVLLLFWIMTEVQAQSGNGFLTQDSGAKKSFITLEAFYTGDIASNLNGGIKQGVRYLGMANLNLDFDFAKAGLWKGGHLFLKGANTHGKTPSADLFGDFQTSSNIEAGNHTYFQELWYKHTFKHLEFTIGLQDLNAEFAVSEHGADFMNSSFGVPSVISNNIPAPIFPLTTLGVTVKWNLSESVAFQTAIYDGCPGLFDNNQYNLHWNISENNGALIFSELQYSARIQKLPGIYKLGYYYHTGLRELNSETQDYESVFDHNYGIYLYADQDIWKGLETRKLALFAQITLSPESINTQNLYLGGGVHYQGLFSQTGADVLGLAVAHAGFNPEDLQHETTFELMYKYPVSESFYVQPDFQYIINPSGTGEKLKNASAFFLRFGFQF